MSHATLDIERARFNMIEQQIRPWEVLDQTVLDLLCVVKREQFVPPAHKSLAFVDMAIPLDVNGSSTGEFMLEPRIEARMLQELALRPDDHVLEIGTGSGYMAALMAQRARHITSVELNPQLAAFAEANMRAASITNVQVVQGDGAKGFPLGHELDAIVISGGLPFIPEAFFRQIKIGGRIAAFVGTGPVMEAEIVRRTGESSFETFKAFETRVPMLHHAQQPSTFKF